MAAKRKKKKQQNPTKYLKRKFSKTMQKKLVMLFMAVILAFIVLVGRITYINATHGDNYTKVVLDQQQYDSRTIPFKRGDILDANGTKIATSERVYNVILDAKALLSNKEEVVDSTKQVLKECFDISDSAVQGILDDNPTGRYNVILKQVSYDDAKAFEEKEEDENTKVAGVWLEEDYVRRYPYNTLASDVIGFVVDGNVGSIGVEASYNSTLNGTDGREYGYYDDATVERIIKEPVNGSSVVLTLDVNLQSIVEKHIAAFNEQYKDSENLGAKNIAVVIMDPNNGGVLAQGSYPDFDLNNPRDLSAYYSQSEIEGMDDEAYLNALNSLWKNFCISDTFEPGSTMKPFTLAAALETGAIDGSENYYCGGFLHVGDHDIHCVNRSGHGYLSVSEVIEDSCNVGTMQIAAGLGRENFTKYQSIFGFGEYTGIDLPGEGDTSGLVYNVQDMGVTDLATNAFGQNFNSTMMQLSAAFCSLINGGNYYEPYVVQQIQDESGNLVSNHDTAVVKNTISEPIGTKIKSYMHNAVEIGTGQKAQVEGYAIGGKTGTAEKQPRDAKKYLNSFIGYAPQDNPEFMIYVIIDEPNVADQAASGLACTLAADIMKEALPYMNVTKSE